LRENHEEEINLSVSCRRLRMVRTVRKEVPVVTASPEAL